MKNDYIRGFQRHGALRASRIAIFIFIILSPVIIRGEVVAEPNQVSGEQDHECRLWGIIGEPSSILADTIKDHLYGGASHDYNIWYHCLKRLGGSNHCEYCDNDDGWGLAMVSVGNDEIETRRGALPAWNGSDPGPFDNATDDLLTYNPDAVVGHVRKASSGSPIPSSGDPHPFNRSIPLLPLSVERVFLFEHNGGVNSTKVRNIITGANTSQGHKDYFDEHPDERPVCYNATPCNYSYLNACLYQDLIPDGHIVDSELYFIHLLKCIREEMFNIPDGVRKAISKLEKAGAILSALNFVLVNANRHLATNEVTLGGLWGLRYYKSSVDPAKYTLYWGYPRCQWCGAIASSIPRDEDVNLAWAPLENKTLIELWMESGTIKYEIHTLGGAVGGVIVPVDKLGLLAPYLGITSTIIVAAAATAIYAKRVKRRKDKQ